MKIITYIYNFFVALLVLLVVNYFLKIVELPQWLILTILFISVVLFFTKTYFRITRR